MVRVDVVVEPLDIEEVSGGSFVASRLSRSVFSRPVSLETFHKQLRGSSGLDPKVLDGRKGRLPRTMVKGNY